MYKSFFVEEKRKIDFFFNFCSKTQTILTGPGFAGAEIAALSNASICFLTFQMLFYIIRKLNLRKKQKKDNFFFKKNLTEHWTFPTMLK